MDATFDHRRFLLERLSDAAELACSLTVTEVSAEGVIAEDADGTMRLFPADTVILAAGMKARTQEVEALRGCDYDFVVVGDAKRARTVYHAVREGFDAGTFVR